MSGILIVTGGKGGAIVNISSGGEPDEAARAVLWLLSSEASYSTGAILDVTGGR